MNSPKLLPITPAIALFAQGVSTAQNFVDLDFSNNVQATNANSADFGPFLQETNLTSPTSHGNRLQDSM